MAATKRSYQQIEADRLEMNRLALAGVPQAEIAERFGLSQPQVAYDLKVVRSRWTNTMNMDIDAAREKELNLLAEVERRAWEGWERAERDGDGGGVRYAAVLLKLSEQRSVLLGLPDHPPKIAVPDDVAKTERLQKIQWAFRQKVRRELLAELGSGAGGTPGSASPPVVTAVATVTASGLATS